MIFKTRIFRRKFKTCFSYVILTYGVKFPNCLKNRIAVRVDDVDPLYRMLAKKNPYHAKWKFLKYLMEQRCNIVESFCLSYKAHWSRFIAKIEETLKNE